MYVVFVYWFIHFFAVIMTERDTKGRAGGKESKRARVRGERQERERDTIHLLVNCSNSLQQLGLDQAVGRIQELLLGLPHWW